MAAALVVSLGSRSAASPDPAWPPWEYVSGPVRGGVPVVSRSTDPPASAEVEEVAPTPTSSEIVAVAAIYLYQVILSRPYNAAFNRGGCPFAPSCSEYGLEALQRFGIARAALMTGDRLLRCHSGAFLNDYDVVMSRERARLEDPARWLGCEAHTPGPPP